MFIKECTRIFSSKARVGMILALFIINAIVFYNGQGVDEGKEYYQEYYHYIQEHGQEDITRLNGEISGQLEELQIEGSIRNAMDMQLEEDTPPELRDIFVQQMETYRQEYPQIYERVMSEKQGDMEETFSQTGLLEEMKETTDYLLAYGQRYDKMVQNAKRMQKFAIFDHQDSVSKANIQKMLKDFEKTSDLEVKFVQDKAIGSWAGFDLPDYFLILIQLIIVLAFFEEKNKGLYTMVRATPGKNKLTAVRVWILAGVSVAGSILFYVSTLCLSVQIYGKTDFFANIQSFIQFENCPYPLRIYQYIIVVILLKACCILLTGCLFWFALSLISQPVWAILCASVFIGGEYLLYANIEDMQSIAILKYANLFSFLKVSHNLENYLNVSLFGHLIEIYLVNVYGVILFALFFLVMAVLANVYLRVQPVKNRKNMFTYLWSKWKGNLSIHLPSIPLQEGYKYFIVLKGLVLLALFALFTISRYHPKEVYYDEKQAMIRSYYNQLDGRWSEEKSQWIQNESEQNEEMLLMCEEKSQQENDITWQSYYFKLKEKLEVKQEAIQTIQEEAQRLEALEEEGKEAYFINPYGYHAIFTKSIINSNKQLLPGMLILVLLAGAVCAYENQSKTGSMILVSAYGKQKVYVVKWLYVMIGTILVWGIMTAREIMEARFKYDYPHRDVAIWNLQMFGEVNVPMSIQTGIILLYVGRLLVMLAMSACCFGISKKCKHMRNAYMICVLLLILPSAFVIMGAEWMHWVSFLNPLRFCDWMQWILNGISKCLK